MYGVSELVYVILNTFSHMITDRTSIFVKANGQNQSCFNVIDLFILSSLGLFWALEKFILTPFQILFQRFNSYSVTFWYSYEVQWQNGETFQMSKSHLTFLQWSGVNDFERPLRLIDLMREPPCTPAAVKSLGPSTSETKKSSPTSSSIWQTRTTWTWTHSSLGSQALSHHPEGSRQPTYLKPHLPKRLAGKRQIIIEAENERQGLGISANISGLFFEH